VQFPRATRLNIWRRENPEPTTELTPVERARVKEMEDEIRRLRMENEFLKKAAAFFARTQP
jgi:transposase